MIEMLVSLVVIVVIALPVTIVFIVTAWVTFKVMDYIHREKK